MEIVIDDVHYKITAEELNSAKAQFSFWEGRRFTFFGTDVVKHALRYNDIVQAALSADAVFEEGEDEQVMYRALHQLKDRGYPYTGSCFTDTMLWMKQLFGNIFRQSLLDELEDRLVEAEEVVEVINEQEQALIPPICQNLFILDILDKYLFRGTFQLAATCKSLNAYIIENLSTDHRDFRFLRELIGEIETRDQRNQWALLLSEFLPKETNNISTIRCRYEPQSTLYDDAEDQLKLVKSLATIDPKSALELIPSIDENHFPFQSYCAVATIYKNSTLCDEKKVFAMREKIFYVGHIITYQETGLFPSREFSSPYHKNPLYNLIDLLEADLGVSPQLAISTLNKIEEFINFNLTFIYPRDYTGKFAEGIRTIGITQFNDPDVNETLSAILTRPLDKLNGLASLRDEFYTVKGIVSLAQTLLKFNREKAVEALELAFRASSELPTENKAHTLAHIAEVYAEFDQKRAFEVAELALAEMVHLYASKKEITEGIFSYVHACDYSEFRLDVFDCMNRLVKILSVNSIERAIEVSKEHTEKMRAMDKKVSPGLFKESFPIELFLGVHELYLQSNPQKALEIVNSAVKWAKPKTQRSLSFYSDDIILKLSKLLVEHFPDHALEVANMFKGANHKCEAILNIVSQKSAFKHML